MAMKIKQIKTTKQHFKRFREQCTCWIGKFGLFEWNINFRHSVKNTDEAMAELDASMPAQTAYFGFANKLPENCYIDISVIDEAAFHEVGHLLLSPLANLARGYYQEDYVEKLEHQIIERLNHVLRKSK